MGKETLGVISENKYGVTVMVKKPSLRYVDAFIRLKCAPDLLLMNLFPNTKEITESMAAYDAVRKYCPDYTLGDPGVTVAVIGDGASPRTGAIFAYRSKWRVLSIDPQLHNKPIWSKIARLSSYPEKVQDVALTADIAVLVHAHVILDSIAHLNPSIIVAMPCCVNQDYFLRIKPDIIFTDWGVHSPKRTINIWKDLRYKHP